MPRLVNWSTSRASSVVPSHGWSAAAPPPSAAEVATSTALEPGATGERRRPATSRWRGLVSVAALFTARQGIRGRSARAHEVVQQRDPVGADRLGVVAARCLQRGGAERAPALLVLDHAQQRA